MTVIFKNAASPTQSAIIENLDAQQFVLEVNLLPGSVIGWDVSNVTPYVQLNNDGGTRSLTGFVPQDSDFITAKTPAASSIFFLNGSFRYMRFRVLSGTVLYAALRAYAPNEAFPGSFLDASDVETVLISYQLPDTASVASYNGRSKVLWVTTGAGRGMYVRDDASSSAATITGSLGQKWFKVTT